VITVDAASPLPPYEQVRLGIAEQIRTGVLPAGTRLPPNTVARAYRELEAAGLVETAGRRGTVVAATGDRMRAEAASAAASFAATVRRLGLSSAEALALTKAALEAGEPR